MQRRQVFHGISRDNHNSDALRQIVHKASRMDETIQVARSPRITHNEIKALKKKSSVSSILPVLGSILNSLSVFLLPGKSRVSVKNSSCSMLGHSLPRAWSGEFPRCCRCKKEIQSTKELHPEVEVA